jgi:proteasome activator-like protein
MTHGTPQQPDAVLVPGAAQPRPSDEEGVREAVQHPAKVMRIGTMVRQLLEEARQAPLDQASRNRLREIFETAVAELGDVLSPELKDELASFTLPFDDNATPSDAELRIAHAQLVGWLEGLFQGIQATLFAQQMGMRAQLEEMRRRSLPQSSETRPGQYL